VSRRRPRSSSGASSRAPSSSSIIDREREPFAASASERLGLIRKRQAPLMTRSHEPSTFSICGQPDHTIHRRRFLEGAIGAGAASVLSWAGLFRRRAIAEEAKRRGKRCILLWLCGGPSQFETWDPK